MPEMTKEEQISYNMALRKIQQCHRAKWTQLDLSSLGLTSVPPELGQLTAVSVLHLQYNRLTGVPAEVGQLSGLTTLYLNNNRLVVIPEELSQLSALKQLFLHGNPALGIPDSLLGPTFIQILEGRGTPARPADILNFYFSRQQAARTGTLQRLNEMKVMLVGDGGAGKTSLLRFFKGEDHNAEEPETLGIALDTFTLERDGEAINVRLWDLAGQEITHALHKFFLTEGCVYLVVVEPRGDSEQGDAEKWLQLIERYGKGSPALLVMNKQDTRQPRGYDLDANALRERFPFIQGFAPTTCGRVRIGCTELRNQLRAVLGSMPEAKLEVPASWVAVKNDCFSRHGIGAEKHYLSLKEFRGLCAKHGEKERAKQESLARLLHQLGAVLHYADDPRLRDTAVLNPYWVTDGAYRLLRSKDWPGSDGTLTLAEASKAVPDADDIATRYLLGLMERFEMCFTLEDVENQGPPQRWLVPGALSKNQPNEVKTEEWRAPDAVRLRYRYDPLPQGVLPRFIVLTHLLSEGEPRWRFGVILHDGAARALIRKVPKETVEVTVQGPPADREKLVRTVRGYLGRIHADLPGPQPREEQALAGTEDFWEMPQLRALEKEQVPIVTIAGGTTRKVSATEELNRTSAEEPRLGKKRPLRVFLSFAHEDKREHGMFRKNLIRLESDGYITFWDEPHLEAGAAWRPEIEAELESMDIFIGLLTTNFGASDFIRRVELKRALERRHADTVELWLVKVDKEVRLAGTSFEGFQVLPGRKSVREHGRLRDGFDVVEQVIHARVLQLWEKLPEQTEGKGWLQRWREKWLPEPTGASPVSLE